MTLATDFRCWRPPIQVCWGQPHAALRTISSKIGAQMTQATFVYYCSIMPEHAQVRSSYGGA